MTDVWLSCKEYIAIAANFLLSVNKNISVEYFKLITLMQNR